ncbi:hypothetical protein [Pediococcus claussenii]|uniref:Uncharacterized protein n=1 Tax=Pediococcus claussenii (strain ATCC BAA-344 / DSM 14800 / JCM 18046 / KCTC 3811 / LMG 21948 / P06) TaxID=701521 RepID=G8PBW1_PEDCP|nr:hypothetical protein [Pediococcus claussenii]AEV96019.1 hypothetical protein PECL_1807 [Pediococcus claussenii ATCC BAA-344]ANZ69504.1 hypothetical protein AYR57_03900 [Pediococcus claussenii]ANZ71323.1 hypothetical protein AYR58_03915 [Pediococcus claussenii]KRN19455.1 hypothetical protein IV79_GL001508 [Pediococcus claussenii]
MKKITKWFHHIFTSIRDYLNPNEANPHDGYVDDELYQNRRSVRRRQSTLRESHYIIFGTSVVGILIVFFGLLSLGHYTVNSVRNANAATQVNQLFTSDTRSNVKSSTTSTKVAQTRVTVKKLHTSSDKKRMLVDLNNADHMISIRQKYAAFYNSKGLLNSNISVKKIDTLKSSLNKYKLPREFNSKYQRYLKNTKVIAKKADSYDKQFKAIKKNQLLGIPVSSESVAKLIKKMDNNSKSQKTVTQQKQLIKLKKALILEEKAQQAALVAQQQAEQEEIAAAQQQKAAKKAANEAKKQQEAEKKAQEQQAQADAASESQAEAESQQEANSAAQQQADQNQQAGEPGSSTNPSDSTGGYDQ